MATTVPKIDDFWRRLGNLFAVQDGIYDLRSQTTQLKAQKLDRFDTMCSTYGRMWSVYFPERSVTSKMHLLTKRAGAQIRLLGCLGDKIEAAVELLHMTCNQFNRLLAAMNDWRKIQLAAQKRPVLTNNPTDVAALEKAENARSDSSLQRQRCTGI